MPQNEHIELFRKRHGQKLDHHERKRKREAREVKFIMFVIQPVNSDSYFITFFFMSK